MMNAPSGQEHVVKKSKYTKVQIAFALKQAEQGTTTMTIASRPKPKHPILETVNRSVSAGWCHRAHHSKTDAQCRGATAQHLRHTLASHGCCSIGRPDGR
jgi:hypothetical protein